MPLAPEQLREFGDVGGDPPGLVVGQQVSRRAPAQLLLEVEVGERVPAVVPDDGGRRPSLRRSKATGSGGPRDCRSSETEIERPRQCLAGAGHARAS